MKRLKIQILTLSVFLLFLSKEEISLAKDLDTLCGFGVILLHCYIHDIGRWHSFY